MAACQAAESMAPTVSSGMTNKLNAAFAKNASHTKTSSGSKTVSACEKATDASQQMREVPASTAGSPDAMDLSCMHLTVHMNIHLQVTKDGATYNINYSTTVYGYNAISAQLTLEQASCTASSNEVGSATGSYTIQLVWNGQTPYGTGITVNGQAKVYGSVCVPGDHPTDQASLMPFKSFSRGWLVANQIKSHCHCSLICKKTKIIFK